MSFSEKTIRTLEFDKVCAMLADCAETEGACATAQNLRPSADRVTVRRRLDRTTDARRLADAKGAPSFGKIRDISSACERAEKGAVLSMRDLLDIASVLRTARTLTDYSTGNHPFDTVLDEVFARLLPEGEAMEVASVQREAPAPEIVVCENADEWKAALVEAVRVACDAGGLTAVIVPWKNDAKRLAKTLDGVTVLGEGDSLPETGIVVVPLKLAKGLEFDRVIIPDASARTFPNSDIARRRLYTTISRATRHLTLLSNGDLTELLG